MSHAVEAVGLGLRYGQRDALADCTLEIPEGSVVGLVGPNSAGKSTLLSLICGLLEPSTGTISVLGARPGVSAAHLARVGFVAQNTPLYENLTVAEHLRLGAKLNPRWDQRLADEHLQPLRGDLKRKAGQLSGGQRAQLALALVAAKRPELLVLDEPVAALDPLARRQFLRRLMQLVADLKATVVLSSHLISDLERICDQLIVLTRGRVQLAGPVEDILATHYRLLRPFGDPDGLPDGTEIIQAQHTDRQSTLTVRSTLPVPGAAPHVQRLDLEEITLAYMGRAQQPDEHD
ncbi:ABC transporter ATP-binding protein [Dactylosporangium cerinum]|uniref:ABC transporter ATP-binding protein n=1 Tax=Dactylosporangium cerinum TaxID=1434730 RepID=A0ABV9VRT2_9ACTN